ncbi:class I SAM-dependent methyltransferase [Ruegeria sp. 2205SS24-7]|uniref:class I SAM-dependent methyltransferase n=1 Tax=Ruegeria discodermiae TaxID=3064389 RepID=UPI0027404967|nr:class I SAM-dependent methyltransferase [Ruegeria sp. 2205SS24-7]MDP5220276.1 class I SAM-dependent methyltransferase [Ruegeria sp. 2205SS24-7]
MKGPPLATLARQTQQVYERNADWFARTRPQALIEKPWLDRFVSLLPNHARILDLGCGSGDPIAAYFLGLGHRVVGMDASHAMISIARQRRPEGDWRLGDMRALALPERFDGIIAWNSFFHLTQAEQRDVLPRMARHLRARGALLLTVGPEAGEVAGRVGDDPVYHASLSQSEYSSILANERMQVVAFTPEDPDCYGMTLLLARKGAD